jgi:hypothetical protein
MSAKTWYKVRVRSRYAWKTGLILPSLRLGAACSSGSSNDSSEFITVHAELRHQYRPYRRPCPPLLAGYSRQAASSGLSKLLTHRLYGGDLTCLVFSCIKAANNSSANSRCGAGRCQGPRLNRSGISAAFPSTAQPLAVRTYLELSCSVPGCPTVVFNYCGIFTLVASEFLCHIPLRLR